MTCLVEKILWRSCSNPPCEALQEDLEDALHDPAQVLHRRSCGDPGGILSNRSLPEDLADAMFYRCLYESSCGRLLGRLLSQDLASSAPAAAGAFMTIL